MDWENFGLCLFLGGITIQRPTPNIVDGLELGNMLGETTWEKEKEEEELAGEKEPEDFETVRLGIEEGIGIGILGVDLWELEQIESLWLNLPHKK